jgi:predicted DNA binding CopG/RHH family protein
MFVWQRLAGKGLPTLRCWKTKDTTDYLDLSKAQRVTFANLKTSTHRVALRLPAHMLEGIENAANKRDVLYQSLIKVWLQEKLEEA